MNSLQTYLDKFGRNFLVASLVPSLAFFTISMLTLQPILSDDIKDLLGSKFNPMGESGLLLVLLTVILGFTLTSLNTFVYKVFEGYVLIWRLPFLRQGQIKQSRQLRKVHDRIAKKLSRLERGSLSRRAERKIEDLRSTQTALLARYDLHYPPTEEEILPTKFGNILKSAETYPTSRYRIDSVPMWPRLIQVMPPAYYAKVDEASNQVSFLMNCTILAACYAVMTIGISVYFAVSQIFQPSENYPLEVWVYLGLFLLAITVSIVFLRASELVVLEYGYLIRSSFDLFRRQLLRQLDFVPPLTLAAEQSLWEQLCYFVNIGDNGGLINFDFRSDPPLRSHQNMAETADS